MTTQPPTPAQQAAEQFRQEVRDLFADLREEIELLRAEVQQIKGGLITASQPAAAGGTFAEMMIDTIVMTYDDNGKPAYKAKGAPYQKHGVRVWDEVLLQFVDPATLKPGQNAITPTRARVLMNTPEEGKTAQPRKVAGKI